MDMLKIQGLYKRFGDKEVLKGLDLSVPEGSVFGFVGQNGSGKTTTMKTVLGLLKADAGEIYVNGERVVFGQTATNRYVGYLPDVPAFYPFMTAKEYLRFCGECAGMDPRGLSSRCEELLSMVGLQGENHRIRGFSRGMKQRLGIAAALLGNPKLLICDEPTSALDPIGRREVLEVLQSVREQTTVLFSTHVLSDVERICTEVALLDGGKIAMQGSVNDLKKQRGGEGFSVEVLHPADADLLQGAFPSAVRAADTVLTLVGEERLLYELLSYVGEHKIPVGRIERLEPSLESLFVEVVTK